MIILYYMHKTPKIYVYTVYIYIVIYYRADLRGFQCRTIYIYIYILFSLSDPRSTYIYDKLAFIIYI